jgi:hypothetical protein
MCFLSDTPKLECPSTITNTMNHLELCANEQAGGRHGWGAISVLVGANFAGKTKAETEISRTGSRLPRTSRHVPECCIDKQELIK